MSAVVLIGVVDSRKRWYIQRCAGLWCSQFAVKTSGWKFGELKHIGLLCLANRANVTWSLFIPTDKSDFHVIF